MTPPKRSRLVVTILAPVASTVLKGLRRYRNKNTGAWLFGFITDRWSASGTTEVWTSTENQALADNGEVASMLGLGTGQSASASMQNDAGGCGAAATLWDSILEQVPGGSHASSAICRRSQKRKGGCFDAIRSDGARQQQQDLW